MVSARTVFGQGDYAQYPEVWKRFAFESEIKHFCQASAGGSLQVLSLGDAAYEQEALRAASNSATLPPFCGKSVKLKESPAPAVLQEQQELLASYLGDLCEHDGQLDVQMSLE